MSRHLTRLLIVTRMGSDQVLSHLLQASSDWNRQDVDPFILSDQASGALMSKLIDTLAALHTSAIDARNGYREAVNDAEGKGLTPLFAELEALHEKHAEQLAELLIARGKKADQDGSFMSVVHKTIMDVRSLFGGMDESVIPGLVDGEQRNVAKYDKALKEPDAADAWEVLSRQRVELSTRIERMLAAHPRT